tara:strand:+ start:3796 stop:4251 length:456 start_codon:yes stop_codon:yes gene_type:complete
MSWSYGNDPENSTVDAVRLFIGDTDSCNQQLSDEEISYFLSITSDSVGVSSEMSARAIGGKFARLTDVKIEGLDVKYSQLRDNYYDLAQKLSKQNKATSGGIGAPVVSGGTYSQIHEAQQDTDRVVERFGRNQFGNAPGVAQATGDDHEHD